MIGSMIGRRGGKDSEQSDWNWDSEGVRRRRRVYAFLIGKGVVVLVICVRQCSQRGA